MIEFKLSVNFAVTETFSTFSNSNNPCITGLSPHHHELSKMISSANLIKTKKISDSITGRKVIEIEIDSIHDYRGFMLYARFQGKPTGAFTTQNGTTWNCSMITHSDKNFKSKITAVWKEKTLQGIKNLNR